MKSPFKKGFRLTCKRGTRTLYGVREFHKGIDLVGTEDTSVYAVADGVVYTLREKNGFGNYVRQHMADGRRVYYAHLSSFCVSGGSYVTEGQKIGIMGATGKAYGAHLHLELRPQGSGADSIDICEYTGIPNEEGEYAADDAAKEVMYSSDEVVNELMNCGIVDETNRTNWEKMLTGKAPLVKEYVRILLRRCCKKIRESEGR